MENVEEARPASGVVSLARKFTSIEDENFPQSIPKEVMCMTGGKDSEWNGLSVSRDLLNLFQKSVRMQGGLEDVTAKSPSFMLNFDNSINLE